MSRTTVGIVASRMAFGASLEAMRKAKGFASRYAYAQTITLNEQKIGVIEKGSASYNIDTLAAYLEGLGLGLNDLMKVPKSGEKKDETVEKRPVGRPSTKVLHPLPDMEWSFHGIGDNPNVEFFDCFNGESLGYWMARETGKWNVHYVIFQSSFTWVVLNVEQRMVMPPTGRGKNDDDAKRQVDHVRRDHLV